MADDSGSDEDNMVVEEVASTGSGDTFYRFPNEVIDLYEDFSGSDVGLLFFLIS